jgi:hypothetical protein
MPVLAGGNVSCRLAFQLTVSHDLEKGLKGLAGST